jgi:hypothetical protein
MISEVNCDGEAESQFNFEFDEKIKRGLNSGTPMKQQASKPPRVMGSSGFNA